MQLPIEHALRTIHVAAVIGGRKININVAGQQPVLVSYHRWSGTRGDTRNFAQWNLRSRGRHDQYSTERVQIVPIICQIANVDGVALATLDGGRDILAAHA
jgi:hypothetical protein